MNIILSYRITWKTTIMFLITSLVVGLLIVVPINIISSSILNSSYIKQPTPIVAVNYLIYLIACFVPITIVHELIHGIAFKLCGRKVKYGFNGCNAYTLDITGEPISRVKMMWILLAPTMVISLLSLILPRTLGGVIYILNLMGSCGDIYMVLFLIKFPNGCYITDKFKGFDILMPTKK